MAKKGLDWFPLDVDFEDTSVEMIECLYGMIGQSVIITLWQYIYKNNGYYCNYDRRTALKLSRRYGDQLSAALPKSSKSPLEILDEIVNSAVQYGVFDSDLYKKYNILTSRGIQKRFLAGARKRSDVNMKSEYLLIDVPKKGGTSVQNAVSDVQNAVSDAENPQSRVDKSRLYKSKADDADAGAGAALQKIRAAYESNIAPITPMVYQAIEDWLKSVEPDVIIWAIKEAVRANARSWRYIEGVLNGHFRAGRTTLAAVEDAARHYKDKEDGFDVYRDEFDHGELEELTRK